MFVLRPSHPPTVGFSSEDFEFPLLANETETYMSSIKKIRVCAITDDYTNIIIFYFICDKLKRQ